ncbi:hypothetical protein G7Y89_g13366 [Cudoniella acicularis]|uniref:AB hydrolase-1 domain-containing protein n=1 Tax=Cudoniella acicularis TaxID=354080 RepID=A0A8H4R8F3_9HELO|nr:hypothetical protein G7Y89_g13366 [Cudoniella acicularis]
MTSVDFVPVTESEVDFSPKGAGKPCKTWYTIFGTFPSPTGARPLICIYGGPGVPHDFLRPIGNLSSTHNIPAIMYDQIGCGRSTHLPEKKWENDFWTMELFLLEFDNLLSHLGIQDSYDILGQSWGGSIGAVHAALQPKSLKKLIIADSSASVRKLLKQFPLNYQETLKKHEADGTFDSSEYQQATMEFYGQHLCRLKPLLDALMASMIATQKDTTVNYTMNGPYVFKRTGTFQNWSIVDRTHKINVRTLLINGKYDGAQDSVMEPFFNLIDKVKWVRFGESSHAPHLEEPDEFLKVVDFTILFMVIKIPKVAVQIQQDADGHVGMKRTAPTIAPPLLLLRRLYQHGHPNTPSIPLPELKIRFLKLNVSISYLENSTRNHNGRNTLQRKVGHPGHRRNSNQFVPLSHSFILRANLFPALSTISPTSLT